MSRQHSRPWKHVKLNVALSYLVAVLCVLAGLYAIIDDQWYYTPIFWALAIAALAFARSKGRTKIETPLFKYEGNLAEEEVPRRFEGETEDEEGDS